MAGLAVADLVVLGALAMALTPVSSAWWILCLPVAVAALLAAHGHYRVRITLSAAKEARSLVACAAAPLVLLALARAMPASALIEVAALSAVAILVLHGGSYRLIRSMRQKGFLAERTLIVGAGQVGVKLSSTLEQHPEYGLRPVGFLDDVDGEELPLPLFGGVELLRMVLSEERIDRVIVAFGVTRASEMLETIRACESASVDIHVLPRFFELGVAVDGKDIDDIWGIPLVRLRRSRLRRCASIAKRALDVSVAGFGLLVLSPLYGLLALSVKISSPGPVYFRQKRVGQHDLILEVLKFRTMRVAEGTDTEWSAPEDRVTKLGALMRRTSLDELPQLWNIIRGDMSLVGPRPERPYFVERFKGEVDHYGARHRVPIGLTGLAQVHGLRGDTSIDERARFDNRYIESWSLWRDVLILAQTFFAVIRDTLSSSAHGGSAQPSTGQGEESEDRVPRQRWTIAAEGVTHLSEFGFERQWSAQDQELGEVAPAG